MLLLQILNNKNKLKMCPLIEANGKKNIFFILFLNGMKFGDHTWCQVE